MKRKRGQITGDDGELLAPFSRKRKRSEPRGTGRRNVIIMVVLVNLGLLAMVAYLNSASRMQLAALVTVTVESSAPTRLVPLEAVGQPTLPPTWTVVPTETTTLTPIPSPTPTATITPSPTNTPQIRADKEVEINALIGWQSGKVSVQPGDMVEITYVEGMWESWPGVGMSGPDGRNFHICHDTDEHKCIEPLPGYSQAGMIGRIGEDGDMFGVGYEYSFVAETEGELQLRINDRDTYDNSGSITMRVVVKRYNG